MSDLETEFSDSSHFAQAGTLSDPSLSQLRDQIKKIMIPLLIKTFQFKLELSQSLSLPSRLHSQKNERSPKETIEQLKTLDNDLKVLLLWCQSCRSQIQKALSVPQEEQKNTMTASPSSPSDIAVLKSFNEAVSAQASFFQQQTVQETDPPSKKRAARHISRPSTQKSWWKKLIGK
ncbi:MAG: hypothetical protein WA347_05725 [Rhabdochlamydiaceae bacterium]|jgi:hypothetical protein